MREAEAILRFSPNKGAEYAEKVLKSAVANAENNLSLAKDDLIVTKAYVDEAQAFVVTNPVHRDVRIEWYTE